MRNKYKQLLALLCVSAVLLVFAAQLFDEFLHARRFVRSGIEKQATMLELDHIIGGKSPRYVYSLQIEQSTVLKTFPYDWTLPIKRSVLVLADSARPDDIALGSRNSSALLVMCYMESCDERENLFMYPLAFIVFVIAFPIYWIRLIRNWPNS